eukprot:358188_1
MKFLRSLISVGSKDDIDGDNGLHPSQSANQLTRPNYLICNTIRKVTSLSLNQRKAYSSINLLKNKNSIVIKQTRSEKIESPQQMCLNEDESSGMIKLSLPSMLFGDASFVSYHSSSESMELNLCSDLDGYASNSFETSDDPITDDIALDTFPTDDFKFMYNIGHGAFGIVHKQFHLKSCQIVAVKTCRSTHPNSIKSFKNEIKICRQFKDCPYIINMIECGMDYQSNSISIALEYMNMASLNKNIGIFKKNTMNRIQYVSVCILNALACLHSELFIHNDVKPENILINDHWEVKLSDFGCIKQMKEANGFETKPVGTEYYQSYEKRFVSPIQYNTKSDIYSFGITICDLLNEKSHRDMVLPFKIPNEIVQNYEGTDFLDFLDKCLERNPRKRWSATQLLNHSFMSDILKIDAKDCKSQDFDDLEFMVHSLIGYYSHYTDDSITVTTPMDNVWTDGDRIQNIATHSGYPLSFVQDFIRQNVTAVKNKYLKL